MIKMMAGLGFGAPFARRHVSGFGAGRLTSQFSEGMEFWNDVLTGLVVPLPSSNPEVRDHCGKSALTKSMTV